MVLNRILQATRHPWPVWITSKRIKTQISMFKLLSQFLQFSDKLPRAKKIITPIYDPLFLMSSCPFLQIPMLHNPTSSNHKYHSIIEWPCLSSYTPPCRSRIEVKIILHHKGMWSIIHESLYDINDDCVLL